MTNNGSNFTSFLWGLGIGVGVALLFAPKAGDETRMYLKDRIQNGKQLAEDKAQEIQRQAKNLLDRSEQIVSREVDRFYSAVDAGREAYRQAIKTDGSAVS